MDWHIFAAAGKYAGLGGIALIVFLYLFRQILKLGIFKNIGSQGTFLTINNVTVMDHFDNSPVCQLAIHAPYCPIVNDNVLYHSRSRRTLVSPCEYLNLKSGTQQAPS